MSIQVAGSGRVVDPAEFRGSTDGPLGTWTKLTAADTDGKAFAFTGIVDPGVLNPPHTHAREDEVTYVLEGQLTVEIGDEIHKAAPGSVVWKPRAVRHAFWNSTDQPVRYFEVISPAGLEGFTEVIGRLAAAGELRAEKVFELAPTYGIEYDLAHTAELLERHNLRLPA